MCVAGSLCMRRLIKVTRRLLNCSFQGVRNVNARMKGGGYTVLDLANLKEHIELADLLRKHGGRTVEELKAEGK